MPNSDPWDRFIHPYLTLISDSYIIHLFLHLMCITGTYFFSLIFGYLIPSLMLKLSDKSKKTIISAKLSDTSEK